MSEKVTLMRFLQEVPTGELCQIIREPAAVWFNPREFAALMELLRRLHEAEAVVRFAYPDKSPYANEGSTS